MIWFFRGLIVFAGLLLIGSLVFFKQIAREQILIKRANRRLTEAKAQEAENRARTIDTTDGTWYIQRFLEDGSAEIASLHNNPLWEINGHREPVTQAELFAWQAYNRRASNGPAINQLQSGMAQLPAQVELLPLLDKAERVLIKGASDAGKTELLRHIVSRSNGVFIVDPHFAPGIWPIVDNRAIGKARNYQEIDTFLARLMTELNNRYQRRATGELNFQPVTLIVDEFQSVRQECRDAGKILSTLVRESRKVGFRLFLGSHSELVKPLGLEGQGDIRDGLLIVRLTIDQITKRRVCTVDFGNGEQECYFPPFASQSEVVLPDLIIQPTKEEKHLLDLIQAGVKSQKQLSESVWGKGKYGKFYNDKIADVLAKYGVEVEFS